MKFNRENASAALDWLYNPGDTIEIRLPKAGRLKTLSGYLNDREKLLDALESASGEYEAVYFTLNPVDAALLARSNNELKPYALDTTGDKEIPRRLNMLIDADPVRPTGIMATNEEVTESKRVIAAIKRELAAAGWTIYTHRDMDRHLDKHEDRAHAHGPVHGQGHGQGHAQGQRTGTRTSVSGVGTSSLTPTNSPRCH
jgi:hypothetical protein